MAAQDEGLTVLRRDLLVLVLGREETTDQKGPKTTDIPVQAKGTRVLIHLLVREQGLLTRRHLTEGIELLTEDLGLKTNFQIHWNICQEVKKENQQPLTGGKLVQTGGQDLLAGGLLVLEGNNQALEDQ